MYAHLPADSRLGLSMIGANHFSFTDQMLVKNPIVLALLRISGISGSLGARQGIRLTEESVRAFLGVYLRGQPERDLREVVKTSTHLRAWRN